MNKERIQSLIDLMKDIDTTQFNLTMWQHDCGSPSCVAGWASCLPSWFQNNNRLLNPDPVNGSPVFNQWRGEDAFADWADIHAYDAAIICGTHTGSEDFYGQENDADVTPQDVVRALTHYMENGLV